MSMKHLIEVAKIVTKKKVKKIEIFDDHSLKHKNSKFNEFYESLMTGKFKNDRDAASQLYNCSPTDDRYRQLKSRFRKRLLNTLFFLDVNTPGTSTYNRAYFTVNKDWTLVKILLSYGATNTAANLASQLLTVALRFKFADIIVNCSRILRQYAVETGDDKSYEEYDQHCKQYQNILDAEIRSEEFYQRVLMNYHEPQIKQSELLEKIDTYCEALVGLSEMYDSPVIIHNMYMVWLYRYEMINDYNSMLEVCQRAKDYIHNNPTYYRDDKLAEFQLKEMTAYLHLNDWVKGKENAEVSLKSMGVGSDEWFLYMESYYLLAMHSGNLLNAIAIVNEVIGSPKYKRLSGTARAKWGLFDIYVNYMLESNPIAQDTAQLRQGRAFKLNKFLSEPLQYTKDQRIFVAYGMIAQALFHIDKKNFRNAEERIERLKFFSNRYMKSEDSVRIVAFIRLLQQLVKASFKPEQMTLVEKYYNRLVDNAFKYRGLITEIEFIPYEKLWGLLVKKLKG